MLCQARERDPTAECDDLLPENGRTGMPTLTPFLWVHDLGLAENYGKITKFQWIIMSFPIKTVMFGGYPRSSDKPISVGFCVLCCDMLQFFGLFRSILEVGMSHM